MASNEEKLMQLYVEVKAKADDLDKELERLKRSAKMAASEMEQQFAKLRLNFNNAVAKMKISEVEALHKKLQAEFQKKVSLNVDIASLERTKLKLTEVERALQNVKTKSAGIDDGVGSRVLGGIKTAGLALGIGLSAQAVIRLTAESSKLAIQIEGVRTAFNRLDRPELLDNLRAATRNTISDFELMKLSMRASNFKIPLEELGTLLEFAQKRATQTGESVEYLANSIVDGIGRKSTLVIDNLGISASRVQEEFRKTGDFAKAVGNIAKEELRNMGDVALGTAGKIAQINASWENTKVIIGEIVNTGIAEFFDYVTGAYEVGLQHVGVWRSIREEIQLATAMVRRYQSVLAGAVDLSREQAKERTEGKDIEEVNKLLDEAKMKRDALLRMPVGSGGLSDEIKNDIDQLNAQLEIYQQRIDFLTKSFDAAGKKVYEIIERIAELREIQQSLVPGSADYKKNVEEINRLQKLISTESSREENIIDKSIKLLRQKVDLQYLLVGGKLEVLQMAKENLNLLLGTVTKEEERLKILKEVASVSDEIIRIQDAINRGGIENELKGKTADQFFKELQGDKKPSRKEVMQQRGESIDRLLQTERDISDFRIRKIENEYERRKALILEEVNYFSNLYSEANAKTEEERQMYAEARSLIEQAGILELKRLEEERFRAALSLSSNIINNLTTGLKIAGHTFVGQMAEALQIAIRIVDTINSISSLFSLLGGFSSFKGVSKASAAAPRAKDGGTFYGGRKVKGYARGGSFIVPPGFPNDSYPIMVQSHEKVKVTPSGAVGQEEQLLAQIISRIEAMNVSVTSAIYKSQPVVYNYAPDVDTVVRTQERIKNNLSISGVKFNER